MYTNEYKVHSKYIVKESDVWRYYIMDMAVVDSVLKLVMFAGVIRFIK